MCLSEDLRTRLSTEENTYLLLARNTALSFNHHFRSPLQYAYVTHCFVLFCFWSEITHFVLVLLFSCFSLSPLIHLNCLESLQLLWLCIGWEQDTRVRA